MSPPFEQLRKARAMVLVAPFLASTGPMVLLLMPLLAVFGLAQAKAIGMLKRLSATLLTTIPLGILLIAFEPIGASISRILGMVLVSIGVLICLFSPLWLAAKLLQPRIGTWKTGGATLLALHGLCAPMLLLVLGGAGTVGGTGIPPWLIAIPLGLVLLALLSVLPLLYALPPIPELEPLAADLGLTKTFRGWQGDGIFLSRRGALRMQLDFATPIPGLYAAKRGQSATRPLLGDAVLDQTLELSIPDDHMGLIQEPALLLEAVHGAGAVFSAQGARLERRLDTKAWKRDPEGQCAQVQAELNAVRALFQSLGAAELAPAKEQHP